MVASALLLLLGVAILWRRPPAVPPDSGTLVLRLVMPAENFAGFGPLTLELDWAGANRGFWRDEGFQRIPLTRSSLRLVPGSTQAVEVARGALPAGHYDRVFVAAPRVVGVRADGLVVPAEDNGSSNRQVTLNSHIEPVARGFDLAAGQTVTIDLEPIVLPERWQSVPTWDIFIKDARLAGARRGAGAELWASAPLR